MTNEMANNETPSQYLKTHDLTRQLERLGVTEEQLQAMRFRGTNKRWPFEQWSFEWLETTPPKAIPFIKAYCALKWLILENPSYSRDKEDAWRLVNETMAAPIFAIGVRAKVAQSRRAKKPRGKITSDGKTIDQVIGSLAVKPQYQSDSAKELWPHLRAWLDEEGLNPEEMVDPGDSQKWTYAYDFRDRRKKITFRRFEGIVSRARGEEKSQ